MPIYQGTLYSRTFIVQNSSGSRIDLTGWEFKMQIRKHAADADPLLELTSANGGIGLQSSGADGRMFITLDETQTAGLAVGSFKFDVLRTDSASGGGPTWLFGGKLKVKQPITRE